MPDPAPPPPAQRILAALGRLVRLNLDTRTVYGDPIVCDGITIIPVARVAFGMGAGSGRRANDGGEGGGAGAAVVPVGYIEVRRGRSRFRSIRRASTGRLALLSLAGVALWRAWKRP